MKNPKCCICGKECENEWGNNPWPIDKDENARCCNECNDNYVIPARFTGSTNIFVPTKEDLKEMQSYDRANDIIEGV